MNGQSVYLLICGIAQTASKNEKISMLQKYKDDELLKRVLEFTYNPFKNYGLSHAPQPETEGLFDLSHEPLWVLLQNLADRRVTGHAALRDIQCVLNQLNAPSAEIFRRILNKDMRAGFSESTINKVFKGLLPEFPYMRCTLPKDSNMDKWNWLNGIYVQEKADGSFANINKDQHGFVWITSRQGSPYPGGCLGIEDEVAFLLKSGTQTHGELTVYDHGVLLPRKTGNGILNSLLQGGSLPKGHHVLFQAWDQIPLEYVAPKAKYEIYYRERYKSLDSQLVNPGGQLVMIPTKIVLSKAAAWSYYRLLLDQGREGVICKHPDMPWRDTGSSGEKHQVKLKLEFTVELKVVGLVPGKPGKKTAATFGSLLCQSACGKLEVGVSGLTDADRERGDAWIGSIVTVKANDLMLDEISSLFLPRLEEERLDKREADTLDQIKAAFEAAKLSA